MKILVTGGAGFIGSHIQDRFIDLDHSVVVLDNFSTGKKEYLNPNAVLVEGSITDSKLIQDLFSSEKFDLVCHHAAQINIRYSFDDPVNDCKVNVIGTLNILKAMIDTGVKKILFASTGGAIYGNPDKIPAPETSAVKPESPYAISKLTCENYIRNLSSLYGFSFTILRYANVYGPRQIAKGEAGVVAIFTEKMMAGKKPVIFGTGEHTRDYVYIDDVVAANVAALESGDAGIYNIGRGIETNVHEVYKAVSNAFGNKALPYEIGPEVPEVDRIALDWSLAAKELDWKPTIDFSDGVQRTVKSFGVDLP